MKIVIDIPQKVYDKALSGDGTGAIWAGYIKNGTPLPKEHGRLIDADALIFNADYWEPYISKLDFDNAPTIIEAESEDKE